MIKLQDHKLIENFKSKMVTPTKIDVVRRALNLLKNDVEVNPLIGSSAGTN